ncbi:HDIG domain-containing metalloprotein [Thermoplasmatota archaeon]
MVEKSDIESCFSDELNLIQDEDLRNRVVEVWKEAAYRGKWKKIDDAPFTLLIENSGKLTDHTKRITKIAKSIFDQRKEKINLDFLVAGALLHDVGKLLEYEFKNGKYMKCEYAKKFRHPVSGALLAKEFNLPDEVVYIIYAHSKEGDITDRSIESIIINHSDFIDFEIKKSLV